MSNDPNERIPNDPAERELAALAATDEAGIKSVHIEVVFKPGAPLSMILNKGHRMEYRLDGECLTESVFMGAILNEVRHALAKRRAMLGGGGPVAERCGHCGLGRELSKAEKAFSANYARGEPTTLRGYEALLKKGGDGEKR